MKGLSILALGLFAQSSLAALPPYWNKVRQYQTVLDSQELKVKLNTLIESIRDLGDLRFEVNSGACVVTVTLEAEPTERPGPTNYSVQTVSEPNCD